MSTSHVPTETGTTSSFPNVPTESVVSTQSTGDRTPSQIASTSQSHSVAVEEADSDWMNREHLAKSSRTPIVGHRSLRHLIQHLRNRK